jgi:hypothetical protein
MAIHDGSASNILRRMEALITMTVARKKIPFTQ